MNSMRPEVSNNNNNKCLNTFDRTTAKNANLFYSVRLMKWRGQKMFHQ